LISLLKNTLKLSILGELLRAPWCCFMIMKCFIKFESLETVIFVSLI